MKYSRKRVRCRCKKFRFEFERVLKISILEFRKIEKFCVHLKCFWLLNYDCLEVDNLKQSFFISEVNLSCNDWIQRKEIQIF